jgi:hypothetical protein
MSMTRNEFKQEAAIRCLQALLAGSETFSIHTPLRDVADRAVALADALTVAYGDAVLEAFYEAKSE